MQIHALVVSALLLSPVLALPALADDQPPSVAKVIEAFRDQFGLTSFAPTRVAAWREVEVWRRTDLLTFPPGTKEGTDTPTVEAAPLLKRLHIFKRTVNDTIEYGLIEDIEGKPELSNPFPAMRGTPDAFVFNNSATPAGEFEETCKKLVEGGVETLGCRTIRPDGGFHYQRFVRD